MNGAGLDAVVGWIAVGAIAVASAPAERPAGGPKLEPERAVAVADGGGRPCSRPRLVGARKVVGGCQVLLEAEPVDIVVLTPYGEFRFARCASRFVLQIGPAGEGYVVNSTMQGDSPCGDARPCGFGRGQTALRPPSPWPLRIAETAAVGRVLRLGACFDTCIGTVRGPLDLRLRGTGNGLKAIPMTPVGTSRVELLGTWTSAGEPVSISPI